MIVITLRILAAVLLIGALLHAWGSLSAFGPRTAGRAWSLGSAGFAAFLAAQAWLVADKGDASLFVLLAIGCAAWFAVVFAFGRAISNIGDPRVLYHLMAATALAAAAIAGAVAGSGA
jgi:hypothetical protein